MLLTGVRLNTFAKLLLFFGNRNTAEIANRFCHEFSYSFTMSAIARKFQLPDPNQSNQHRR